MECLRHKRFMSRKRVPRPKLSPAAACGLMANAVPLRIGLKGQARVRGLKSGKLQIMASDLREAGCKSASLPIWGVKWGAANAPAPRDDIGWKGGNNPRFQMRQLNQGFTTLHLQIGLKSKILVLTFFPSLF